MFTLQCIWWTWWVCRANVKGCWRNDLTLFSTQLSTFTFYNFAIGHLCILLAKCLWQPFVGCNRNCLAWLVQSTHCLNCTMYLSKIKNVFVQMAKCILEGCNRNYLAWLDTTFNSGSLNFYFDFDIVLLFPPLPCSPSSVQCTVCICSVTYMVHCIVHLVHSAQCWDRECIGWLATTWSALSTGT